MTTPPLYKHTLIIWSETDHTELGDEPSGHWMNDPVAILVQESINGSVLLSRFSSELVEEPRRDSDFPDTDFFDSPFEEEHPQMTLPFEEETP